MYHNGTDWVILASGTEGQLLEAHGVAAPTWETVAGGGLNNIVEDTTPELSDLHAWQNHAVFHE